MPPSAGIYEQHPLLKPWRQVRLLFLKPGDDEEEISCDMHAFDIEEMPAYNAVSYAWGDLGEVRRILVDGISCQVGFNCHYALWQARRHYSSSFVWIDSICISQDDLLEKGYQVAMMGDIYATAKIVLACIGPHDKHSLFLSSILSDPDFTGPRSWQEWIGGLDRARAQHFVKAEAAFSKRAYFTRLWVVQELFAGGYDTRVLCGDSDLSWLAVFHIPATRSIPLPSRCHGVQRRGEHGLSRIYKLLRKDSRFAIEDVIPAISSFKCTDVRDRVYGALNMMQWATKRRVRLSPDYSISAFVLTQQVAYMMKSQRLPDLRQIAITLGIGDSTPEVQEIVHARQQQSLHLSGPISFRTWLCPVKFVVPLVSGNLGSLTVDMGNDSHPRRHSAALSILKSRDEDPADVPNLFRDQIPIRVHSGSTISALVCHRSRPGDVLACTTLGCLVLRQQASEILWHVVGRAVLVNGFEELGVQQGWEQTDLQLLCSTEDAVIWASEGEPSTGLAVLERLVTDIPARDSIVELE